MTRLASLTDRYAAAPHPDPAEFEALRAEGFEAVICNRPDAEVPPQLGIAAMRAAAEAAGLSFHDNPVPGGGMTLDHVNRQREILDGTRGKTLAYCASGTRATVLWALTQAGEMPTPAILDTARKAGYAIDGLGPQIDALARSKAGDGA